MATTSHQGWEADRAVRPWRVRLGSAVSLLIVFALPFAVSYVPTVGGLVGFDPSVPGANPVLEFLKFGVMAAVFFAPFVVGAWLGRLGFRRADAPGWRMLGLAGLMGNLLVIALGVMFALGEVLNPH